MNLREMVDSLKANKQKIETGWDCESADPRPGATRDDIAKLEEHLGYALPEDYREFLSICNGWRGLRGGLHFMGTQELSEKQEFADYVVEQYGEGAVYIFQSDQEEHVIYMHKDASSGAVSMLQAMDGAEDLDGAKDFSVLFAELYEAIMVC